MKATERSRVAVLIAHVLFLGTLVMSGCATNTFLTQGKEYAARGEWDKSVQAFQQAHYEDPNDQEVRIHLIRAKRNASLFHMNMGESLLENHRYDEAMTELQLSIALDPSNKNAESLIEKTRAMKESDYQLKRGESLLRAGNYTQAKEALQTALKLYPENKQAQEALARFRHKETRAPRFRLKTDPKTPISLKFKNTPILNVFEVLTRLTGINFLFDKDVQETKVTMFVTDVSFDEFLDVFLRTNKLAADMVNDKTLIIYPDTQQKAKEYQDLQIRTFYLAHIDVKKAVALLSKVLKTKDITPNEALNAVVIRGPKEQVEIAAKIIEANDRPVSEVMLSVEIMEVSRTKELNLGVEFSSNSFTLGLGASTYGYFTPNWKDAGYNSPSDAGVPLTGGASFKALDTVSNQNMLLSFPTATVNLLKQDGDTRILANPQLRVKNGEKAKIHIGERVPLRSNRRVDTTGAVTTDFQYQDIGVKVDVEPSINVLGDVAMKLTLEISSLGANVGTTSDPQYAIRTRTAQSVLNIRAGETVVIGGLIQDEERKTVRTIPGIGEIPVLGHLLSNRSTTGQETDILMTITPVIVRNQEVPDQSITHIWSGKEDDFSQREPFGSIAEREGQFMEKPVPLTKEKPAMPVVPQAPGGPIPRQAPSPPPPPPPKENLPPPPAPEPPPVPPKTSSLPAEGPPAGPAAPPGQPPPALPGTGESGPPPAAEKTIVGSTTGVGVDAWPASFPYSVQVNSYATRADAQRRLDTLTEKQYEGFLLPGFVPAKGRTYYRVFVGKFDDYQSAKRYCEELKKSGDFRKDAHVVTRSWAVGG